MKKQILFKSFILLFVVGVSFFGFKAVPIHAFGACSASTASITVSTPSGNPPTSFPTEVTISWSTDCYDNQVVIGGLYNQTSVAVDSSGSDTHIATGPEQYTLAAFSGPPSGPEGICPLATRETCAFSDAKWFKNAYLLQPATPQPATVNVNNTCQNSTWSSTGQSGGYGSSSFTVNPPTGGQTITMTPGSLPSEYRWDSITPAGSQQQVYPGGSIGFGLSCSTIRIEPTLSASPNPYQCGGNTTLTWSQRYPENVTYCNAQPWSQSTAISGSQVVTPTTNPQTYGITCYGANGATGFASISVPMIANSCTGANVKVDATPASINSGENSTIAWTGTNVVPNSCVPGWNWTSSTGATGSQYISNILSTTNYPMDCTSSVGGPNPSGSATVTVVPVNSKPVISISASPTSGTAGVVNPQLTWSASGSPTSCTASGDWSGAKASSGSGVYQGVLSSVKTYTYTLNCTNDYGTGTSSATVVVSAAPVVNGSCGTTPTHWNCAAGTSANNAGTGPWTWNCNGSGGGTNASCSEAVGGFTYSLSSGGRINVNKGTPQTNTVTRTAGTGTQGSVTLTPTVLPPDLTIQGFSSPTCTPTCVSTITFFASNTATLGEHTVTITGSPASSNGPVSFIVNVLAGSSPVVSCSPSSSSALIGQPVTWSANVSGGTPPYTYVWSGTNVPTAPAPTHVTSNTTDTYASTYTTTGLKHATVRVTDTASNFGDCSNGGYPGSDIQINFNPTFQEF